MRAWKTPLAATWVVVSLAACVAPAERVERTGAVRSAKFFEQAVRRDPTEEERGRVARLGLNRCAAFFVENSSETTFVVTALHCVDYDIESWCANDGWFRAGDGVTDGDFDADGDGQDDPFGAGEDDPNDGWCSRIIASEPEEDIALFEADLPHRSTGEATFRLAAYTPKPDTRLLMTGFPGDSDPTTARKGKITTTEDCWTLGELVVGDLAIIGKTYSDYVRHNCTVYGGNSGGPIAVEGTRDAIGLPADYTPDDYVRRGTTDFSTAASLHPMSSFVARHREALEAAGITIAETQDPSTIVPAPPAPAFASSSEPEPEPEPVSPPPSFDPAPAPEAEGCALSTARAGGAPLGGAVPLFGVLAALVARRRRLVWARR